MSTVCAYVCVCLMCVSVYVYMYYPLYVCTLWCLIEGGVENSLKLDKREVDINGKWETLKGIAGDDLNDSDAMVINYFNHCFKPGCMI